MNKLNRVLLIDDDSINNFITISKLKKLDVANEIIEVKNGWEGLSFVVQSYARGESYPELILVDIDMPRMDGFEFLESFRKLSIENKQGIVVVVISNSSHPDDMARLEWHNVNRVLLKPVKEADLIAIIKDFFN